MRRNPSTKTRRREYVFASLQCKQFTRTTGASRGIADSVGARLAAWADRPSRHATVTSSHENHRPETARRMTLGLIFAAALVGLAEVVVRTERRPLDVAAR